MPRSRLQVLVSMLTADLNSLPVDHPEAGAGESAFDWAALVALTLHPLKVGIIEALRSLEHPLAATELAEVLADAHYSTDLISYHAAGLVKLGVLEVTETCRVRGALRNYYYFSKPARMLAQPIGVCRCSGSPSPD